MTGCEGDRGQGRAGSEMDVVREGRNIKPLPGGMESAEGEKEAGSFAEVRTF